MTFLGWDIPARWHGALLTALVAGCVVVAILMVLFLHRDGTSDRFGASLRGKDLASLPPAARLDRLQVELERRQALHLTIPHAATPLMVLARWEDTLQRQALVKPDASQIEALRALADAYHAIDRPEWANLLRQAADGHGKPEDLARRWTTTWSYVTSRQAQLAYLDAHLLEILP